MLKMKQLARWAELDLWSISEPQGVALGWMNNEPLAQQLFPTAANG
jgi:hypothetical protein